MLDFTFLKEEQIFGDKQLEIFKKYGTRAAITDFANLLGAMVNINFHTCEGKELKDRTSIWLTNTSYLVMCEALTAVVISLLKILMDVIMEHVRQYHIL